MAEEQDLSMLLYSAAGAEMADRELALVMAEMLFKRFYGADEFETQLPFIVTDGGDRWIIKGSRDARDYPAPPDELLKGSAEIEILKANCEVVRFARRGYLQVPAEQ